MFVAAETGSGKTHAYLIPLIEKLYNLSDGHEGSASNEELKLSLVFCPNVLLCEQLVRMACGLCDDNGEPLLNATALGGRQALMIIMHHLSILELDMFSRINWIRNFGCRDGQLSDQILLCQHQLLF